MRSGLLFVLSGLFEPFEHSCQCRAITHEASPRSFFFFDRSGLRPSLLALSGAYGPTYFLLDIGPTALLSRLISGLIGFANCPDYLSAPQRASPSSSRTICSFVVHYVDSSVATIRSSLRSSQLLRSLRDLSHCSSLRDSLGRKELCEVAPPPSPEQSSACCYATRLRQGASLRCFATSLR